MLQKTRVRLQKQKHKSFQKHREAQSETQTLKLSGLQDEKCETTI